jgi:hypothetical protein
VLILLRLTYFYIYNLPNLSKIKFLANLLAGLRGAESPGFFPECPGFSDIPDLARRVQAVKV